MLTESERNMEEKTYYWSFEKGPVYRNEAKSIETAIREAEEAREEYDCFDGRCVIYVGEFQRYEPELDGITMIEWLQNDAAYLHDEESLDWLEYVKKEDIKLLEDEINKVIKKWLKATNNMPDFGNVVNVQAYSLMERNK